MKTQTVRKTKKGKLLKYIYTKGPFIGEYFYLLFDANGNFVERFSNRELNRVNEAIKTL